MLDIKRREFITLAGSTAAAWPLAARAQQPMPVIGFLSSLAQAQSRHVLAAFQRGLGETGYVDGRNVAIDYRFADGQYDRLPAFASEYSLSAFGAKRVDNYPKLRMVDTRSRPGCVALAEVRSP